MKKDEIVYRLFDILNETDNLPIQDLIIDDRNGAVNVYLVDGTRFSICVESFGNWCLNKVEHTKFFC